MSAKPFHRQHAALILHAANECDEALLFVSLADRSRPNEITVLGADMRMIWQELIEEHLPSNVSVEYTNAPVKAIWATLGRAKDARSHDTFVIYGDEKDLSERFGAAALQKYVGPLHAAGQIVLQTMPVDSEVRGTHVRRAIAVDDFTAFKAAMPAWMDAKRAWQILTHRADESTLRSFIRDAVRALV